MRKQIALLLLTTAITIACAQKHSMSYQSIEQAFGKQTFVTGRDRIGELLPTAQRTLIEKKPGKYKKAKVRTSFYGNYMGIDELPGFLNSVEYTVLDEIVYKDSAYIRFAQESNGERTVFVIPKSIINRYVPMGCFLNMPMMAEEVNGIFNRYFYLNPSKIYAAMDFGKTERNDELKSYTLSDSDGEIAIGKQKFCRVTWEGFRPLNTSKPYEVAARVGNKEFYIHSVKLHKLIDTEALVDDNYLDSLRTAVRVNDSIDNAKDRHVILATYFNDTIAMFAYRPTSEYSGEYHGFCRGVEKTYRKYQSVRFLDSKDDEFLQRRGDDGLTVREKTAHEYDSLAQIWRKERLLKQAEEKLLEEERQRKSFDSILAACKSKQIFIFDQEYVFAEYGGRFGLKWTFYNCFNKEIKYIKITVKPYNKVGDIQRDDIGRKEALARCIGPLEKGEFGTYSFEKLFWDDNDIIDHVNISNIVITFKDNSTKVFSEWNNIKKRMLKYN